MPGLAATARLAIGLAGGIAAVWLLASGWSWASVLGALLVWIILSAVAGMAFRRLASKAEIRADLEDRTRNTE